MNYNKIFLILFSVALFVLTACATKPVCKNSCEGKHYKSTFYFEPSKTDLDLETREEIKQLAQNMGCGRFRVRLEGHADISGSSDENMVLGDRRTQAVKDFIISLGIPEDRIEIVSFGEDRPADKNYTPQAYSKNRRVEVVFIQGEGTETSYSSPNDIYVYDGKVKETYQHAINALKAQQLLEAAQKSKLNSATPEDTK